MVLDFCYMNSNDKDKSAKLEYSGEKFRMFLQRNDISYKEAAETLGIDKNTVGKAVRGGNMNVDMVLRICNCYGLKITDFFACRDDAESDMENQYNSLREPRENNNVVLESNCKYKKCENIDDFESLEDMLLSTRALLSDVAQKYDKCCDLFQTVAMRLSKKK